MTRLKRYHVLSWTWHWRELTRLKKEDYLLEVPINSLSLGVIFVELFLILRVTIFCIFFGWLRPSAIWWLPFPFSWHNETGKMSIEKDTSYYGKNHSTTDSCSTLFHTFILKLYTKALYQSCKKSSTEFNTIYFGFQSSVTIRIL